MSEPISYVHTVPDHCDRIIWRGRYYHLPVGEVDLCDRYQGQPRPTYQPAAAQCIIHGPAELRCVRCGERVGWDSHKTFSTADKSAASDKG